MDAILLNQRDNVATALRALSAGTVAQVGGVGALALAVVEPIPLLHKVALFDLPAGTLVVKYGEVIGVMAQDARAGSVVHVHNMRSRRAQQAPSTPGDAAAQLEGAAHMWGLEIAPPHRPGTLENLARLASMVRPLLVFPLPDDPAAEAGRAP